MRALVCLAQGFDYAALADGIGRGRVRRPLLGLVGGEGSMLVFDSFLILSHVRSFVSVGDGVPLRDACGVGFGEGSIEVGMGSTPRVFPFFGSCLFACILRVSEGTGVPVGLLLRAQGGEFAPASWAACP